MIDQILAQQKQIAEKKKFKPFTSEPFRTVCEPIRKKRRAIFSILAGSVDETYPNRVHYAKKAGIEPDSVAEDGTKSYKLSDEYTYDEKLEALARELFNLDESPERDWDELNEAEVMGGLLVFFTKVSGTNFAPPSSSSN